MPLILTKGSGFYDLFEGTTLDTSKWTDGSSGLATVEVNYGFVKLTSTGGEAKITSTKDFKNKGIVYLFAEGINGTKRIGITDGTNSQVIATISAMAKVIIDFRQSILVTLNDFASYTATHYVANNYTAHKIYFSVSGGTSTNPAVMIIPFISSDTPTERLI